MLVAFRKVSSKSLPNIKILFLHLKNFEKQIRSYKKRKTSYHKAFHMRRAPLFDKMFEKRGSFTHSQATGILFFTPQEIALRYETPELRFGDPASESPSG